MAAVICCVIKGRRQKRYRNSAVFVDFNLTDRECRERYRFAQQGINYLCGLLREPLQNQTLRSHALTVREKLLMTLRFLATGNYMQTVGDTLGRDKATVSHTLSAVIDALCDLRGQYIVWPDDVSENKRQFYRISGFPNVLGCVDGTHVRILKPGRERQKAYINRKRFASINVMAVVGSG